ncbi:MAG: hypothetical protein BJ554DRAFT_1963, partial [Olpidium bornovanus]
PKRECGDGEGAVGGGAEARVRGDGGRTQPKRECGERRRKAEPKRDGGVDMAVAIPGEAAALWPASACMPAQHVGVHARALNLLVHHLDSKLLTHYGTLQARFNNRRVILLPQAKLDCLNLRVMDFRSISEYDARFHEIVAKSDMIERTLTSLPVGSAVLAEQYCQWGYASYHELAAQLQLAERNLHDTAERRLAGAPAPESHMPNLTGVAAAPSATSAAADLIFMDASIEPYEFEALATQADIILAVTVLVLPAGTQVTCERTMLAPAATRNLASFKDIRRSGCHLTCNKSIHVMHKQCYRGTELSRDLCESGSKSSLGTAAPSSCVGLSCWARHVRRSGRGVPGMGAPG